MTSDRSNKDKKKKKKSRARLIHARIKIYTI